MRNFAAIAWAGAMLIAAAVAAETGLRDDTLVVSVETKVREIQPSRDEKRFDEIGWAPNILAAEALARTAKRPVCSCSLITERSIPAAVEGGHSP